MKKLFQKIKETPGHTKGEISFESWILICLVVIFVFWILSGGAKKPLERDSLFEPMYSSVNQN